MTNSTPIESNTPTNRFVFKPIQPTLIRLNEPNVPFDQFILKPDFDIIYKKEYINANNVNRHGIYKLQLAFLYDKITKQYKMLIHSSNNSYLSAYGISDDEWFTKCVTVETTDDIVSLRDTNIDKIDRVFVQNFIDQMNNILLIMRYKSISKSIKFLYNLFDSSKHRVKLEKYWIYDSDKINKENLKLFDDYPTIVLYNKNKIVGFSDIHKNLSIINLFYVNNKLNKKFKRTLRNTWLRFRYKINNMFKSQPSL